MSLKSGRSNLEQFDVTFDNQGEIGLTADIGGYTQEFFKAMEQIQKNAAGATPEKTQAQALATLGLMQQLTIANATLRYDDASFAMRALEIAAATQNARASDLPGTAQMLLPMLLPQYLPPEMVQQVTAEAVEFLRDPKNIEIQLNPPKPAPLMLLLGAKDDPKTLVEVFGLTINANQ